MKTMSMGGAKVAFALPLSEIVAQGSRRDDEKSAAQEAAETGNANTMENKMEIKMESISEGGGSNPATPYGAEPVHVDFCKFCDCVMAPGTLHGPHPVTYV